MHNFTSAHEATNWCRANAAWNDVCLWVNGAPCYYASLRVGAEPSGIVVLASSVVNTSAFPRTRNGVEVWD